ncbi:MULTISPECIES: hypothetical protein [unclassified Devosia]|uniref:hypothetical protein n=1 Tax=unclassified Devosia TaxID=196773 RepID=UPI00086D0655|nr:MULTISPECIES: hypothetical protein [unclassified Devosia]MBN9361349.1 hypothetical protein [Devosia sp.]ODS85912.1 MAG: hypothetical protein ABS47_15395 [Devosia sp. SCN 66-27]OJX26427.1 MAG: hypothetical protein BGO83_21290 [Devosia sp. 66-14]
MAHSRGFDLSHFTDDAQDRFGRQFASLARDASQLSGALARYSNGARHDVSHLAHDFADGAVHQGAVAARVLGKQAWRAGKAVRRDPAPAVAAVVGLACLVTLVMASGTRRR